MRSILLFCLFLLIHADDEYFSISVRTAVPQSVLNRIAHTQPENYESVTHVDVSYPTPQHITIFLVKTVAYRDMCLFFLRNVDIFDYEVELSLQHEFASVPWFKDRLDQATLPLDHRYHSIGTGAGVDMYIIDSGINRFHNEFGDRVTPAWRVDGEPETPCGSHGTAVASVAAGATVGIASTARIFDVRVARNVLNCAFYTSDAINALAWVAADVETTSTWGNITRPAVINLSWIGAGNSIIDTLIALLFDMGLVIVAAAGNSGSSLEPCAYSPARAGKAIAVGATDRHDRVADFSNYGNCIDMFAPGVDIIGATYNMNSGFIVTEGTSLSCPLVAGLAAVLYSREDFSTSQQVVEMLRIIAVYNVIPDLDSQSPNRLLNFYSVVQSLTGETLIQQQVATGDSNRLVNRIF